MKYDMKGFIKATELTVEALAKRLGVSKQWVYQCTNGKKISDSMALKILTKFPRLYKKFLVEEND